MTDGDPGATHLGFDSLEFRRVLGHFPTGVVAITAVTPAGEPAGMAVGSFTSVSLEPPLVAFLPAKSSTSFPKIRAAGRFCVNVLSSDQEHVSRVLARKDADKFAELQWRPSALGSPMLAGSVAWIDCEIEAIHEAGDHYIVVGRVRELDVADAASPLLFFQGGYGRFWSSPFSLSGLSASKEILELAQEEMVRLANGLRCEVVANAVVGEEILVVGHVPNPDHPVPTRVGSRSPFAAPLGTLFAAWAGPERAGAWIDRHGNVTPALREKYEHMLELVRERGWSVILAGKEHMALEQTISDLPASIAASSERAALRAAVEGIGFEGYEPEELDPSGQPARFISAPVFDSENEVVMQIGLYGMSEVDLLGGFEPFRDQLVEAAARVTRAARTIS